MKSISGKYQKLKRKIFSLENYPEVIYNKMKTQTILNKDP